MVIKNEVCCLVDTCERLFLIAEFELNDFFCIHWIYLFAHFASTCINIFFLLIKIQNKSRQTKRQNKDEEKEEKIKGNNEIT